MLRTPVRLLFTSVYTLEHSITTSGFFMSRASLAQENAQLKTRLTALQAQQDSYTALTQENSSLRAIAHFVVNTGDVTAPITSSITHSPYNTFSIGAGSLNGLSVGSIVRVSGGFVIGKVSTVSAHQALVTRILAPNAVIDAVVHGTEIRITGTGGGNGQGTVPRGTLIVRGDAVTAPQYGNAEIAIVGAVQSTSTSPYQNILVFLPVNLLTEPLVLVSAPFSLQ
jgi:cell shape-determining protein MreC